MSSEATVTVNIDDSAVAEFGKSPEVQAAISAMAERLREIVSSLAPGEQFPMEIETQEIDDAETATTAVYTDSPLGHLIELGTGMRETREGAERGEMPAFAPFRRGIEQLDAEMG